ncbi:MAG: hypothetical protein J5509_09295 [Lachnospiraceae bacterium]|nr:hypothetical protein [Lachnospiraceae bacterium]
MKKVFSRALGVLLTTVLITICAMIVPVESEAATGTFIGTVSEKTTIDVLYLITKGGTMEIKIDANTNLENCKFLLPGYKLECTCYTTDSDEYWHAANIKGNSTPGSAAVDTSQLYSVTGTIAKGTNEGNLVLKLSDGTLQIKIDPTTDCSGVRMFILGRQLQVIAAKGTDGSLHAQSISDTSSSAYTVITSVNGFQGSGQSASTPTSVAVGKVDSATTASTLVLNTTGGQMQVKIDSNVDLSQGHVLMPETVVSVEYYKGTDNYLHTGLIVNSSAKQAAPTTLDGNSVTVSGTVGEGSSESTIYLQTSGGTMQIRLDTATDYTNCPLLLKGKSVTMAIQRGADEYYHAISVAAK